MRMIRNATIIIALLLALGAAPARATDEPPTYQPSGRGKALLKTASIAKFTMRPARHETMDLPDVPDNDPTVEGGTIAFYELDNPSNRNDFALPAGGWSSLGPGRGFRYRGAGVAGDPCKTVMVKATVAKAICRGSDVTLTPPLGSSFLGVTLTVGTNSKQYCAGYYAFTNQPGVVRGVPAIVSFDKLCSPSGAFLDAD